MNPPDGYMSSDEEDVAGWELDPTSPLPYPPPGKFPGTCGICCTTVESGSVGVVQRFGKYVGYSDPGCLCFCPPIFTVLPVSVAVQQIDCRTDCKTQDNVTLTVQTAVQYNINKAMLQTAVFDIINPHMQIRNFVDNVVRSTLAFKDLDDAYAAKDELCNAVIQDVRKCMAPHGYNIVNALITDLSPEQSVLQAMNAINAAKRQREAAIEQGEGMKTLKVKNAEADAEAKYLSGVGYARMRRAMADGFKDSMLTLRQSGLSPADAVSQMLTTQYIDTLRDVANNPRATAIMVPSGSSDGMASQIRNGYIQGSALTPSQQTMAVAAPQVMAVAAPPPMTMQATPIYYTQ